MVKRKEWDPKGLAGEKGMFRELFTIVGKFRFISLPQAGLIDKIITRGNWTVSVQLIIGVIYFAAYTESPLCSWALFNNYFIYFFNYFS